jgi:SAM-dependent methyltransferase
MIHQRALEYLLGLEGAALLRSFVDESEPGFGRARVAEMRRLLSMTELDVDPVAAQRVPATDGYRVWSRTYDEPGNGLFPAEEAAVHAILAEIEAEAGTEPDAEAGAGAGTEPGARTETVAEAGARTGTDTEAGTRTGLVVDAACGTGRHSEWLAARGYRVIGVDGSPEMLARARERVPGADFREGRLDRLPLPDAQADVVVCALALTHVQDLRPVFAEFARVLRPGGDLVISDVNQEWIAMGSVPRVRLDDGRPALMPGHRHRPSDYLGAALPAGFRVMSCAEPRIGPAVPLDAGPGLPGAETGAGLPGAETGPPDADPGLPGGKTGLPDAGPGRPGVKTGSWESWPWSLTGVLPHVWQAVTGGIPTMIIWHFRRDPADR